MRTCSPDRELAKVHTLWPSGQFRPACAESRQEREKRKRDEQRERERVTSKERETHERKEIGRREIARDTPVCTFTTLPCVHSKNAPLCSNTGVLTAHSGAFWMYTRGRFSVQEGAKRAHTQPQPRPQQHAQLEHNTSLNDTTAHNIAQHTNTLHTLFLYVSVSPFTANQHHFLTTNIWDVLTMNANRMKSLLGNTKKCLNHVFLLDQLQNYQGGRNFTQKLSRGPTTWRDMLRNASRDTANWQTKRQSSCTRLQVLAWMIINSKRRSLNQLENYPKYAHILFLIMLVPLELRKPIADDHWIL